MRNYCTLFDRNYVYKGLTLYFSMVKHCADFKLWILCLDDITYQLLNKMRLPQVELVTLTEFEDENLLRVKKERNVAEYSWTCTSNLCRYILENKTIDSITYLDADLFFFNNPNSLFEEIGNHSIAIIEHRFPAGQEKLEKKVGRFNVGFVYFRNDESGREAVNWWADKVIEWCYDRLEKGRYGDQMYLDDWPTRFPNVLVIKHPGVALAPWNIKSVKTSNIIFYHFHAFKLENKNRFIEAKNYFIPRTKRISIYQPYKEAIKETIDFVCQHDPKFNYGFSQISSTEKLRYWLYNKLIPEQIINILTKLKHYYGSK